MERASSDFGRKFCYIVFSIDNTFLTVTDYTHSLSVDLWSVSCLQVCIHSSRVVL